MGRKLPESIVKSVVRRLTEIRKDKHMSHETVARISGLHRSTISLIESEKRQATLLTCLKIAYALECSLGDLINKAEKEFSD